MQIDDIAANVRALRHRRGLSQEQLARACGFDVSLIANLERGRTVLPGPSRERVAHALGVRPGDLLRPAPRTDEEHPAPPDPTTADRPESPG